MRCWSVHSPGVRLATTGGHRVPPLQGHSLGPFLGISDEGTAVFSRVVRVGQRRVAAEGHPTILVAFLQKNCDYLLICDSMVHP